MAAGKRQPASTNEETTHEIQFQWSRRTESGDDGRRIAGPGIHGWDCTSLSRVCSKLGLGELFVVSRSRSTCCRFLGLGEVVAPLRFATSLVGARSSSDEGSGSAEGAPR